MTGNHSEEKKGEGCCGQMDARADDTRTDGCPCGEKTDAPAGGCDCAESGSTCDESDAGRAEDDPGRTAGKPDWAEGDSGPMPAPVFSTFVLSLASSALVQLGEVPDPATGKHEENLVLAQHSIDILSMLRDKTKNGLDADESRLLDGLLYELRMKFVMKK